MAMVASDYLTKILPTPLSMSTEILPTSPEFAQCL